MTKYYTEDEIFEIRAILGVIVNQMEIIGDCHLKEVQEVSYQTEMLVNVLLHKIPDPAL